MPILDRNAVAMGRHAQRERRHATVVISPKQPARFGDHLLFLIADKRHNIAENVERSHARIARPRDRLHRRHKQAIETERVL